MSELSWLSASSCFFNAIASTFSAISLIKELSDLIFRAALTNLLNSEDY
ncbi:hypothetical protein [Rickettsia sp. TH2014]|nr:hypothetical protein [Rickettsia sp. TH2014]